MTLLVDPQVDEETETTDGPVTHIVKVKPGENAATAVLESRINGTPLEALCGHVWVPTRDPKQHPMCQKCVEVYEMYRATHEGLYERPTE